MYMYIFSFLNVLITVMMKYCCISWRPVEFDLIECFMTTFLHTHSWLNWVDEDDDGDEVGLK